MIVFRHCDPRFPFLWESPRQPAGRWHDEGEGPAHYLADTPHGAWAEFLRHEEIRDVEDLAGVRRALWAIELPRPPRIRPALDDSTLLGGFDSYPPCRRAAAALRARGVTALRAPSAALRLGGAQGFHVDGGVKPGAPRDGEVFVLFGRRPDLIGWPVAVDGRPPEEVLARVRHF